VQSIQSTLNVFFRDRKFPALLLLGFASGLPLFLTSKTLQAWMTVENVDLKVISWFSVVALPYSLKFVWSPVMDRFIPPILGRRRGWLLITQIALVPLIAIIALQNPSPNNPQAIQILAFAALAVSFFSASQDIAGDAYRTDVLRVQEREAGASLWVLGYRLALAVTFFLALRLVVGLEFLKIAHPWQWVYLLMAVLMAVGLMTTLWAPDPPMDNLQPPTAPINWKDGLFLLVGIGVIAGIVELAIQGKALWIPWIVLGLLVLWVVISILMPQSNLEDIQEQHLPQTLQEAVFQPFQEFVQRKGVVSACLVLVFILLYKLGDSLVGNMATPFLLAQGFSKELVADVQGLMGFFATTTGVFLGGIVLTKVGMNRSLWIFGVLQLLSNFGYYALSLSGQSSQLMVIAINIENICAGFVTVATVAYFMSLCDKRFTTTQFALFSSLMAISRDVLATPAGQIVEVTGWPNFFLLTIAAAVPGLLMLPYIAPWNQKPPTMPRPGLKMEL
jgi:MFS transporter, PAT family, beta-lactamase induction signal transducer AmpG